MSLFERYLSVWVFACIVAGVALGRLFPATFEAIGALQVAQVNLPVGLLMADQYPVDHWIREVTEPVFIAHGDHDQTIDVYHGKRLYELARNPQGLWIEPGADHDELWAHGIWDKAKAFFQQVEAAKTGAANENGAPQGAASQPAVAGGQ